MAQQGDKGLETELLAPTRQGKAENAQDSAVPARKRAARKNTQKPNLLFIMTDQQRFDALSIAGNPVLQTPNLDRLARQGAYFRHAYTPCAVCAPARASILTGHTVEHTGANTNNRAYNVDRELLTMPTFDEILTEQGYHCEYYGKWHTVSALAEVYKNPLKAAENGKSIFGPGGQRYVYLDYLSRHGVQRKAGYGELIDKFTGMPYRTDPLDKHHGMTEAELTAKKLKFPQCDAHGELLMPRELTLTAFQATQTIEAITRLKDRPFSITCSFHFPHAPMLPPEPYYSMYPAEAMVPPKSLSDDMENSPYRTANGRLGNPEYADIEKIRYMISNYYGLVKEIDDWVGEILKTLEAQGLANRTMVIFTSDHGEMLGAHGMREKNVFYEESAHIPLIIRFPGEVKRNTTINAYVSNIDLFATILDYLKVDAHPSDGQSLRGLIEGTDSEHGQYVVTEWDYRGDTESNYMIVKDGWKLIIPYSKESRVVNAMYDLQKDPYEMNNLLGRNPDRHRYAEQAEALRACLLEWLEQRNSKHIQGVKERDLI
jgi:arylsulfatase A-like enzyme